MKSLGQILDEIALNPTTLEEDKIFLPLRSMFNYTADNPRKYFNELVIHKKSGIEVSFCGQELGVIEFRVLEALYDAPKDYGRVSMVSLLELLGLNNTPGNRTAVINSLELLKRVRLCVNWYFEDSETFRRPYRMIPMYLIKTANLKVNEKEGVIYIELEDRISISKQANYEGLILKIK